MISSPIWLCRWRTARGDFITRYLPAQSRQHLEKLCSLRSYGHPDSCAYAGYSADEGPMPKAQLCFLGRTIPHVDF